MSGITKCGFALFSFSRSYSNGCSSCPVFLPRSTYIHLARLYKDLVVRIESSRLQFSATAIGRQVTLMAHPIPSLINHGATGSRISCGTPDKSRWTGLPVIMNSYGAGIVKLEHTSPSLSREYRHTCCSITRYYAAIHETSLG